MRVPARLARLKRSLASERFWRTVRFRVRTQLHPLERRVYIGFAVSGIAIGLVAALAYSSHAKWANTWLPSFIAEWSGIFIAVVVIDRLRAADRERKAGEGRAAVNSIPLHSLASCVEPIAYYAGALIGAGDATGYQPARFNSIVFGETTTALTEAVEPWADYEYGDPPDAKKWRELATQMAHEAASRAGIWLRDWPSSVQRAGGTWDVHCALTLQKVKDHLDAVGTDYSPRRHIDDYDPWAAGHAALAEAVWAFYKAVDQLLGAEGSTTKVWITLDRRFREFSADTRYRDHADEAVPATDGS